MGKMRLASHFHRILVRVGNADGAPDAANPVGRAYAALGMTTMPLASVPHSDRGAQVSCTLLPNSRKRLEVTTR